MPGFERTATIGRSPAEVFAVLDDVQAAKNWMPAIRNIEVLTPYKAVGVGYRWRETRRIMGIFRMRMVIELVEHDAPTRWGLKIEDPKFRATATFVLSRQGSGTTITLREDVDDLQGKPKRAARMAKMMEKSDDDVLVRLKTYVESLPVRLDLVVAPSAKKSKTAAKTGKAPAKANAGARAKRAR